MVLDLDKDFPKEASEEDHFYYNVQSSMRSLKEVISLNLLTSRSTEQNLADIQETCRQIQFNCYRSEIPTEGVFLRKTDLSVKAFKYLVCNTGFECQSRLTEDPVFGYLVDVQPPISIYLLLEVLWHVHFEDILAEALLHFPLDLGVEIIEVLPRAADLLDFQRESRFLTTLVPNVYKKLILARDVGSQTKDAVGTAKRLAGNLQELLLQFSNERFLKLQDLPKSDHCKRYGILLKLIIQMVRLCLTSKCKAIVLPEDLAKMYKLTFGREPIQKIDDSVLQELLAEIDRELINLLLKKVKEIDCNIYLDWTEHDDEENTSLTLQRAIGLEAYYFIEIIKDLEGNEYKHLVECLQQIASKPDPSNSLESMQLTDLCHGAREGRTDCLIALFRRYKEWDDTVLDAIDSNISILTKDECERLLEHLAEELQHPQEQLESEKLQNYCLLLVKAMASLKITELYEMTVRFILRFSENDKLESEIDIANFQRFVMLNPSFSSAKNFRVVLFYLCLNTGPTLKILIKMAIGHSDYPDVAVSIDDLKLLVPVLKIQTQSTYSTLMNVLTTKCTEKAKEWKLVCTGQVLNKFKKPKSVTLVVRILQQIVLEGPGWNANKFSNLLQLLYSFCQVTEIIEEVIIPFLMSDVCSASYLKYILVELHKNIGKYDCEGMQELVKALEKQGMHLLKSNHISKYVIDELLTLIIQLADHLLQIPSIRQCYKPVNFICSTVFLEYPINYGKGCQSDINNKNYIRTSLFNRIGFYSCLHQSRLTDLLIYPIHLITEDMMRQLLLKCTKKQYIEYLNELLNDPKGMVIKCQNAQQYHDTFIRLTLETCLLCLEYPEVAPTDTVCFLIRCLMHFLSMLEPTKKKRTRFYRELCKSLDKHVVIFKDSIERTAIADAYEQLVKQCQESNFNFMAYAAAFEQFALRSIQESEKLKIFEGPHSPLGIKLWLAYSITNRVLEDSIAPEEYMRKLGNYFTPKNL